MSHDSAPVDHDMTRVLVVIPAWNERANIESTLSEVQRQLPGTEILVVDDGSDDDTAAIAADAGVHVLRLPYNLGVGGAMRAGFKYAVERDFDAVVQIDADGQHDPAEAHKIIAALHDANVVVGARFDEDDTYVVRGPRRWAMSLLAFALSRIARTRLTDTTSGYRAADRRAIRLFARYYPAEYLGDTVESLIIAKRAGFTIRQVPVRMRPRRAGEPSQPSWKATLYLGRAVMALLLGLVRRWPGAEGGDENPEAM